MKTLKSLLTNRYNSTCIIVVCGLKALSNQDQFQRIQKLNSVDLKSLQNLIANVHSTKM